MFRQVSRLLRSNLLSFSRTERWAADVRVPNTGQQLIERPGLAVRRRAGEQLVEHDAQRINVRARVDSV